MSEARTIRFDTRRDCAAHFRACVESAQHTLDLFDPDVAVFPLGTIAMDAALRAFFARGGRLRLALHDTRLVERDYPRFLVLLRDFGHLSECRQTPRGLRQLTDSFCIGDRLHVVRRFHSDHMRGEAAFDHPSDCELPQQRFEAIWEESRAVLQASMLGL